MKLKDLIFRSGEYIRYLFKAGNAHGLHSPFVYALYTECIRQKEPVPYPLKKLRKSLAKDTRVIEVEDFGAGGIQQKHYPVRLSRIATVAAKSEHYSFLLARLCRYFKAQSFLELGTSIGLSTATVKSLNPETKVITIEGSESIRNIALENFKQLGLSIDSHQGDFDAVLPDVLKSQKSFDIIFIDGNHRKEPTLRYFEMLLPHVHENSVIIFDDIHWSREMKEAWNSIQSDSRVTLTVDLFAFGVVFFKSGRAEKESFILRS